MKWVLLAEDSDEKALHIIEVLSDNGVSIDFVRRSKDIRSAHMLLEKYDFALVILDMTFQVSGRAHASTEALAGLRILQHMAAAWNKTPVVITTQHEQFSDDNVMVQSLDELRNLCLQAFPENFCGAIHVRLGEDKWKSELDRLVKEYI